MAKHCMVAYSEALKLHDSGLGADYISRELNIPLGTVDGWLYKGQRKILEENNWDVVDLWEYEINQDVEKAVTQVFQGK